MLGNLRYQTRPPDETLVYISDVEYDQIMRLREDFPEATFNVEKNRNDWGHEKRARGLAEASSDFIGFFNDDDSYAADYIEKMLGPAETGNDVVYCAWTGFETCAFQSCSSTSGNYIVRTQLGREAGYKSRDYIADGHFINAIRDLGPSIHKVPEVLYFHNEQ